MTFNPRNVCITLVGSSGGKSDSKGKKDEKNKVKKTKIMEKNKRMIAFGAAKQIFARDDMFTQPLIGSSTP